MAAQNSAIVAWLRDIGLERYDEVFRRAEITLESLLELTDADLRELGLPLGPRKILLKATATFATENTPPASHPAISAEAERRQLTIAFIDLVGSTALSSRLDPEEMYAVLRTYQNTVAGEILRFDGHVAKYMGDGVLAYFGWPRAHEDDAERAVRAALEITSAISKLDNESGERLSARVGIATGLVMVGDLVGEGGAREQAVVGETPNLASRLQAIAESGTVVISEPTRQLLGGLFDLRDLGARELKGIEGLVQIHLVNGERVVGDRFSAHQSGAPLPLIGRDQELALVIDRWRLAKGGEGQVVVLSGEPGIGKSRIILALRERLRAEPRASVRVRYNCSPFHKNSPFYPAIEQLSRAAGFNDRDDHSTRISKLGRWAAEINLSDKAVPYLIDLLGLLAPERYALPPLTPEEKRSRTFRALLGQNEALATRTPVCLILEDAHWCDPTTLDLFDQVTQQVASLPILLVITYRPEFSPRWVQNPHVTTLTLDRLGPADAATIVTQVAGCQLPPELTESLLTRADGVPLYLEELTKAVLEAAPLAALREDYVEQWQSGAVPQSLQGSLLARLDRLGVLKEVAQAGAVVGREFTARVVAIVMRTEEAKAREALRQLVMAGIMLRRATSGESVYSFKHALLQDAAYQSLLKSRRQELHARVAEAIEASGDDDAAARLEVLARHLTEAGLLPRALPLWEAAGERAWRRSAHREAIAHLRHGLEVATRVPGAEGRRATIRLETLLGASLTAAFGPRQEAIQAYERASRVAGEMGETGELLRAQWGRWYCTNLRADLPQAGTVAAALMSRAGETDDRGLMLQAHHAVWTTAWQAGDLEKACKHAQTGVELYREADHHDLTTFYGGHDAGACCRNTLGITLWLLGCPDQAAARADEGVALARRLSHPFTLAATLGFASWVRLFRGDHGEAALLSHELIDLCTGQGMPVYLAVGRIVEAASTPGAGEEAAETIRNNIEALQTLGARARQSFHQGLLAHAYLRSGRLQDGLAAVDDGLRFVAQTGERWYEPELHRLKGELTLSAGRVEEARSAFQEAITIANERGALAFKLRAAIRLARLQGHTDSGAGVLLGSTYARFTEGRETSDLIEARDILDCW